jgi:glucose/arabinose dehydrogenase
MRAYRKSLLTIGPLLVLACFLVAGGSVAVAGVPADGTESLPPGARVETVLTGMDNPIALAFDPSGRLFYTEKNTGQVRLFANGKLQPQPVITFTVSNCSERGLLGIAVDPRFAQDHFIYVYYTQGPGCGATQNKVARFVENNGVGSNPTVIFSSPQTAGNHNGGNIHFGPDGKLYISVGDNANAANAQDATETNGKMHRINSDGSAPTDNPRFSQPGALPSLYALGLRNSFDFTFDSVVKGRIFASENGPDCDDEMNRIEAGQNYGWRANYPCDDANPDPQFNTIRPLWYLPDNECCEAPTGIEVYKGSSIPEWKDGLFMSSYQQGAKFRHFYLNADRTALTASKVVQGITAGMDVETGPDGALYYIEGGGYAEGTLKRIVGSGGLGPQASPTALATAPAGTPAPAPTIPGSGSQTFPETGKSVSGIFLDYWKNNGGLPQQGFPISGLMNELSDLNGKAYVVQYFERAVFEYHPENQPPYNVLLSQLGTFRYKQKYPNGAPNQTPNNSPGSVLFPQTGHRVGGKFLDYWKSHGGVLQQGYPISEEFTEVSDLNGKSYTVQYFERAVFEMHPENQPPYDVLLSQLGTFRYKSKYGGQP